MLGNKEIMAQNILRYLEYKRVSRKDLCNALGIKYTTFQDWIHGKTYPRIDKIELMANYFGCQKKDLVEEFKPLKQLERLIKEAETCSEQEIETAITFLSVCNQNRRVDG